MNLLCQSGLIWKLCQPRWMVSSHIQRTCLSLRWSTISARCMFQMQQRKTSYFRVSLSCDRIACAMCSTLAVLFTDSLIYWSKYTVRLKNFGIASSITVVSYCFNTSRFGQHHRLQYINTEQQAMSLYCLFEMLFLSVSAIKCTATFKCCLKPHLKQETHQEMR